MLDQFFLAFAAGAGFVFIGDLLYERLCGGKTGLTNFQRFLFSTGFSYSVFVAAEILKFLFDYYVPGSELQHYRFRSAESAVFLKLLGKSAAGTKQLPVLATDIRIFLMMLGAFFGGAVLLVLLERKSKKTGDGAGLFSGFRFEKISLKGYIRREAGDLRKETGVLEYTSWWVLRLLMCWVIIRKFNEKGFEMAVFMLCVNLGMTFFVPAVRALFFAKVFFGRIPYRVQTYINIFIFTGSFFNHGLDPHITEYDKYLHVISGGVAVLIGYELIGVTRNADRLPVKIKTLGACGFSCVVIALWELFEFTADFLIPGSNNQNLDYSPDGSLIFFRIFGRGADNPGMEGLLDTDIDMFFGFFACVLCGVGTYLFLRICEERKKAKKPDLSFSAM